MKYLSAIKRLSEQRTDLYAVLSYREAWREAPLVEVIRVNNGSSVDPDYLVPGSAYVERIPETSNHKLMLSKADEVLVLMGFIPITVWVPRVVGEAKHSSNTYECWVVDMSNIPAKAKTDTPNVSPDNPSVHTFFKEVEVAAPTQLIAVLEEDVPHRVEFWASSYWTSVRTYRNKETAEREADDIYGRDGKQYRVVPAFSHMKKVPDMVNGWVVDWSYWDD